MNLQFALHKPKSIVYNLFYTYKVVKSRNHLFSFILLKPATFIQMVTVLRERFDKLLDITKVLPITCPLLRRLFIIFENKNLRSA